MADNEWYDSYISNYYGRHYFFLILETGATAVYVERPTRFEIGSFFKVKIARTPEATENMKAQHQVIQLKPMEPLGMVRVEKIAGGHINVYITTIADVISYVETRRGRVAKLFNDKFGTFIDMNNLVQPGEKRVEFEFKSIISPLNKYLSVFVPTNIIGYLRLNVKRVIGFVHSPFRNGGYNVWSSDLKEDAWLPENFCPGTKDLYGFWIEMTVDDHFDVVEQITVQREDIFVSRLVVDYPEVLADIWYDGYDSVTRCHVYNHKEFGLIIDNYHLIENPKQGDLYEAWIACVSTEIPGCRWAMSGNQKTPLLLKSETSLPASKGDNSRNDRSRSQFSSPHRPSRAGNNGAFRRRSSSSSASRGRSTDEEEYHYENGRRSEPPRNQSSRGIEADGNDKSDESRRRKMTRNDSPFSRGQSTDSEREVKGIHGQVPVSSHPIRDDSPASQGESPDADDLFSRDGFSESETEDVVPARRRAAETNLDDESDSSVFTSPKGELPHVERLLNDFHFGSGENATTSRDSDELQRCGVTVENKKIANCLIKCFLEFSKHPNVNRAMRLDDVEKFEDLLKDVEDFKKITS